MFVPLHCWHARPWEPQLALVVPATQTVPAQHPTQVDGPHWAAPSVVPASSSSDPQTPPVSPAIPATQSSPRAVQSVHDWPPKPHAAAIVPGRHPVVPQQPDAQPLASQRLAGAIATSPEGGAASFGGGANASAEIVDPTSEPLAAASMDPASFVCRALFAPQPKAQDPRTRSHITKTPLQVQTRRTPSSLARHRIVILSLSQ
ncbi:MAG TPA: hypothetical protein VGY54_22735 [Polyangiaceae bacterium]|jgi:hypothetical protein|nr:hypothetical protein [Polyangiaceae bacterium]